MPIHHVYARSSTPPTGAPKNKRGEHLAALITKNKKTRELRRAASKKGAVVRRQNRLQQQQQQQQQQPQQQEHDERASPAAAGGLALPGAAAALDPAPDVSGLAAAPAPGTSPVAGGTPAVTAGTRQAGTEATPAQRPKQASRPRPTECAPPTPECPAWPQRLGHALSSCRGQRALPPLPGAPQRIGTTGRGCHRGRQPALRPSMQASRQRPPERAMDRLCWHGGSG